jgi:hypothetical protein
LWFFSNKKNALFLNEVEGRVHLSGENFKIFFNQKIQCPYYNQFREYLATKISHRIDVKANIEVINRDKSKNV